MCLQVLLLLVYHDIMNDRCTLNALECDVEVSEVTLSSMMSFIR